MVCPSDLFSKVFWLLELLKSQVFLCIIGILRPTQAARSLLQRQGRKFDTEGKKKTHASAGIQQ